MQIDKQIELRGAGATDTVLQSENDTGGMIVVSADGVGISAFSFRGRPQGSGAIQDHGIRLNDCIDFRIYDTIFQDFGAAGIDARGADTRGVVARSDFINIFRPEINNLGYGVVVYGDGDTNWNRPLVFGSEDFVFIEDCTFVGNRHGVASNNGARYVFRHNESSDPRPANAQHVDAHGLEYGSSRGTRGFEVYFNTIRNSSDPAWVGILIRGGDGLIYDNAVGPGINNAIMLANRTDGSGDCNYPNQDQTTEMYVWNNTNDGQAVGVTIRPGHECLFEEGRDYFQLEMPGYVPYPYPHPLLSGSGGSGGAGGSAGAGGAAGSGAGGASGSAGVGGTSGSGGSGGSGGSAGAQPDAGPSASTPASPPLEEGDACACRITARPSPARSRPAIVLAIVVGFVLAIRRR